MLTLEEPVETRATNTAQRGEGVARRLYERRTTDTCAVQVEDDLYPVENWSQGGVLLGGDGRFMGFHQLYNVALKFKLNDRVLNITHQARVVRKAGNKTALQFLPLTAEIRRGFQQVIDDMVASQFAGSQA